eukprot:jgi/Astpho2/9236/Aster-07191
MHAADTLITPDKSTGSPEQGQVTPAQSQGEKEWSHPADMDGWVKSHDALRLDMSDFERTIGAVQSRLSSGADELPLWQAKAMQHWFTVFVNITKSHHDHEEQTYFPKMQERVQLPPKLTADHKDLVKLLLRSQELVNELGKPGVDAKATITELQETFGSMASQMREHLKEEEDTGLALLRQHFSEKEVAPMVAEIVKDAHLSDFAWILRPMDENTQTQWMSEVARVPKPVQYLLVKPALQRYLRTVTWPLEDVAAGERQKHPVGWGAWLLQTIGYY